MSTILVIAEHRQNELRPVTFELISAALGLKKSADDKVQVAVIGIHAESYVTALSVSGVDEVMVVKTSVADFDPDIFEATLSALIESKKPTVVLLPHSVDSLGYAATLASKLGCGFATDVFIAEYQGDDLVATRGGYNQKVNVEIDFPSKSCVVMTIRAGAFKPLEGKASPVVTNFDLPAVQSRSQNKEYIELGGGNDIDITAVEFIMSIGRGIGEETNVEQFRELAGERDHFAGGDAVGAMAVGAGGGEAPCDIGRTRLSHDGDGGQQARHGGDDEWNGSHAGSPFMNRDSCRRLHRPVSKSSEPNPQADGLRATKKWK